MPSEIRERRLLEIESDLWEQLHDPTEVRAGREILGRVLRGIHSDVWWRYRTLLDLRGARRRSHVMNMNTRIGSRWWTPVSLVIGIVVATMGILGMALGETASGGGAAVAAAALPPAIGGLLILAGLGLRGRRLVVGCRLIIVGAVLIAMDPIFIPVAGLIIIGGLFTGDLVTSERDHRPPVAMTRDSMTTRWYRWIVAGVVLGGIGFATLLVGDAIGTEECTESNPCWEGTAVWATWVVSWLAAMVTGGIGIVLGLLRLLDRHHTRSV
jgi:hypothetical protein